MEGNQEARTIWENDSQIVNFDPSLELLRHAKQGLVSNSVRLERKEGAGRKLMKKKMSPDYGCISL